MKKRLITLFAFCLIIAGSSAQKTLQGKVKDLDVVRKELSTRGSNTTSISALPSKKLSEVDLSTINNQAISLKSTRAVSSENVLLTWDCDDNSTVDLGEWYIYDLDGLTPATGTPAAVGPKSSWFLAYIEKDPSTNPNSGMVSQSMFEPTGQADDWLVSEPITIPSDAFSYEATWDGKSIAPDFLDSYEFRIIDDVTFEDLNASFTSSTLADDIKKALLDNTDLLLTVTNEKSVTTFRGVSIDGYKGKKVRVIWRNISDDKFILSIDNISVHRKLDHVATVTIANYPIPTFMQIPKFLGANIRGNISTSVTNRGSQKLSDAVVEINGYKNDEDYYTNIIQLGPLAVNEVKKAETTELFSFAKVSEKPDAYYFDAQVRTAEGAEDFVQSATIYGPLETDSVIARDNGILVRGTGINPSLATTKVVGSIYGLAKEAYLSSVTFRLVRPTIPKTRVRIFEISSDGRSISEVATSGYIDVQIQGEDVEVKEYTVPIGFKQKAATTYIYAVEEDGLENLSIGATGNDTGYTIASNLSVGSGTANDAWSLLSGFTLYIRGNLKENAESSISEDMSQISFVRYTAEGLLISGAQTGSKVSVYSISGTVVLESVIDEASSASLGMLDAGAYIVKVGDEVHKVIAK